MRPLRFLLALALLVSCKKHEQAPPLDESQPAPGQSFGGTPQDAAVPEDGATPAATVTVLAEGFGRVPQGIAVGATSVYFTLAGSAADDGGLAPRSGSVMRVDRTGGEADEIAGQQDWPYAIARYVTPTSEGIAWSNRGTQQDTGGAASTIIGDPLHVITNGEEATGLAADNAFAYWISTLGDGNIVVERAPLNGGPDTLGSLQTEAFPEAVRIDAQYIYFVASGTGAGVFRVPISVGASVETLASLPDANLTDIDVVGDTLYVVDSQDNGSVLALPRSGGRVTTIASNQKRPSRLTHSQTALYWTNDVTNGSVWVAPFANGATPHPVVSQLDRPYAIAWGDTVYFTTWDAVLKINP